jgi:uncharacterized membrane protein YphA (DoxX/SURF4 family)
MSETNLHIAELLLRVFAGVLFLFQGYDKLFRVKISGVVEAFQSEAAIYQVPKWILYFLAYYTSLIEFFGGMLLVLGLFSHYALYALGIDLILVSIAFSFIEPMWDTKHVFPRLALIIILLVLPSENNPFSIEYFLKS